MQITVSVYECECVCVSVLWKGQKGRKHMMSGLPTLGERAPSPVESIICEINMYMSRVARRARVASFQATVGGHMQHDVVGLCILCVQQQDNVRPCYLCAHIRVVLRVHCVYLCK